jgi:RNA polymerase sigma-70 factor (ECF subfamily)
VSTVEIAVKRSATTADTRDLVKAAQRDLSHFAALYNHHVQSIYRYIYSRVGSQAAAEDITSQTFLSAMEALPNYRERGHFRAWLFAIARRKVVDHYRQQRPDQSSDLEKIQANIPDPLQHLVRKEEFAQLYAAITELTEYERELIRLRYVADLPFAEIGKLVGKSEGAAKKALYRLLDRLQIGGRVQ